MCATTKAEPCLSSLATSRPITAPEFTLRYNEYRGAQIFGSAAPGYALNRRRRPSKMFSIKQAPRNGLRLHGYSYRSRKRAGVPAGYFRTSLLFVFLILRHLRKLTLLQRPAGTPVAVFGPRTLCCVACNRPLHAAIQGQMENDVTPRLGCNLIAWAPRIPSLSSRSPKRTTTAVCLVMQHFGGEASVRPLMMTALALLSGGCAMDSLAQAQSRDRLSDDDRRHAGGDVIGSSLFGIFYVVENLSAEKRKACHSLPPSAQSGD